MSFFSFFICNDNRGEIHGKGMFMAGKISRLVHLVEYVPRKA